MTTWIRIFADFCGLFIGIAAAIAAWCASRAASKISTHNLSITLVKELEQIYNNNSMELEVRKIKIKRICDLAFNEGKLRSKLYDTYKILD